MIVGYNYSKGIGQYGCFEDLPRVDGCAGEASYAYDVDAVYFIYPAQVDCEKHLPVGVF